MLRRIAAVSLVVSAAGCSLDLDLPTMPQRGRLIGMLDTGSHIPPDAREIDLISEDNAKLTAMTDATGAFVFDDLVPGVYFVQVDLPGFAPYVRPNARVRAGQTVDVGALTPTWLQGTPSEATLHGRVVVQDGASPQGGTVEFTLEGANQQFPPAPIGPDGDFIQRLVPGTWKVVAHHPLYTSSTPVDVTLLEGEYKDTTADPVTLGLNPATLTGQLLKEVDGASPVAAAGVQVTLENGDTTTTDTNGNFRKEGLPGGPHTVRFALSGWHDSIVSHDVTLQPAQTTALPPVTLSLDRGTLVGTVSLADQQPARDVTVSVTGTNFSAVLSQSQTEPWKGTFQITGIPVGTYEVAATKARYSRAVVGSVAVTVGATTDVGTLVLTLLQGDFVIDDGDPTNTAGYTRTTQVTLQLAGFANAAQFHASEDPAFAGAAYGPYTGASQPFTLGSAQGTHTVYAQFKDSNGIPSPVFSSSIVLDSVAPAMPSILINGGGAFTKIAQPLAVTLTADETAPMGVDAVSGLALVRLTQNGTPDAQGNLQVGPVPYQRDTLFTRPSATDGVQDVFVQFIDHAGNASMIAKATVVVDTMPPTGSLSIVRGAKATADGFTNTALVTLTEMTGTEPNGGYVLVKLANSQAELNTAVLQPVRSSASWFLDPSTEGPKTVYALLQDAAGNTSQMLTANITYDVTPPSMTSVTLSGTSPTSSAAVTLNVAATDMYGLSPTQAVTASEDPLFASSGTVGPSAMPGNGKVSFTLSAGDGPKQIFARFRDTAGNDSTASVPVTLDTTPPSGSISLRGTLADGSPSTTITSTTSVTVLVNASGASGILLGNETLTTCPTTGYTPLTATSLPTTLNGTAMPAQVNACLIDAAGNRAGPLTATIVLDTAAPASCALTLTGAKADGTAAPAGKTAVRPVTAGIASCSETPAEMFLTTGSVTCSATALIAWQPFGAASVVSLTGVDGSNTVNGCVRDAAHNVSTLPAASITLDTTGPSPATATLVGPSLTNQTSVTLNLAAMDVSGLSATQAVTVSEDPFFATASAGPAAMSASIVVPLSAGDGAKTLYVRFRDALGNDTKVSVPVTLDATPPTGSISLRGALADGTPSTVITSTPSVTVLLNASGATGLLLGNETLTTCPATGYSTITSTSIPTTLSGAASPRQVNACLIDAAGNKAGPLTATLVLDSAAPAGCLTTLTGTRVDGTAAPAGRTAQRSVTAGIGSCGETPTEMFLTTGSVTCSATAVLAWQPFSASSLITLTGADGSNTVNGCVRDAARNVSSLPAASITLDTTGPSPATATLVGPSLTNQTSVTLNLAAMDVSGLSATQAVTVSEDPFFATASAGPAAMSASISVPLSAGDGAKTLYVRFRDALGNDTKVSVPVTLDATPPTGSISLRGTLADGSPSTAITSTTSVTVLVNATGASGILLGNETLTTCPATGYTSLTSTSLPTTLNGTAMPAQVNACLIDAAGNRAGPLTATIVLDTAAPASCALTLTGAKADGTAAPASKTAVRPVTAGIASCSETPSEMFLTTGSVTCSATALIAWQPFSASSLISLTGADGPNTVNGCVRDAARNVSALPAAMITLDTTGPSPATATLVGPALTNQTTVTLTLAATDPSGLSATQAVTASEDPFFGTAAVGPLAFPGSSQISVPLSPGDGFKTVFVRLRDALGNDTVASAHVTLDTTPPTGSLSLIGTLADGTSSSTNTSTTSVTALLTQSGAVEYLLGNETLLSCPATGYTTLTTNSIATTLTGSATPREVHLCLRDAATNAFGPVKATLTLDSAAPAGCASSLSGYRSDTGAPAPAGKTGTNHVTVAIAGCGETPSDMVLSTTPVTCSATASLPWVPYAATADVVLAGADGTNSVYGCVRDVTRNVGTLASSTITLDTTPPLGPQIVLDNGATYVNRQTWLGRSMMYTANAAGTASGATEWSVSASNTFTTWLNYATQNPTLFDFGGTGLQTIHAVFRDDVGNVSAVTTDQITFDVDPPIVTVPTASLNVVSPTGNAFTNTFSAVVQIVAPSDAVSIRLAPAASPATGCAASDLTSVQAVPLASAFTYVLPPGDGLKRMCATLLDAAANESTFLLAPAAGSTTITVDTLPPTAPVITTAPATIPSTNGQAFTVATAGPVTELNFLQYERLGGTKSAIDLTLLDTWTQASTNLATTSFGFNLQALAAFEAGVPNVLRLRAKDKAGNVSPEATVVVTADAKPPNAVTMNALWVDNGDGKARFQWQPNQPAGGDDIASYKVYYGSSSGVYTGTFAIEGNSPIVIPKASSYTLSGLTNGSATYVRVRAVDFAGNESAPPGVGEVVLEPNVVSPNLIATAVLPGVSIKGMVVVDDFLYVVGLSGGNCNTSTAGVTVQAVDMRSMVSPIQGGVIQLTPPGPTLKGSLSFADNASCPSNTNATDLLVDGQYLFITSGSKVRVISLAVREAPVVALTLDFATVAPGVIMQSVGLVGDKLIADGLFSLSPGTASTVFAVDLSKLYDNNSGTTVSLPTDLIGSANNGHPAAAAMIVSRDRASQPHTTGGYGGYFNYNLDDALDESAVTPFDTGDRYAPVSFGENVSFRPVLSGNYMYMSEFSTFTVYTLNRLWGSGQLAVADLVIRAGFGGGGPFAIEGAQAFIGDKTASGLRSLDLTNLPTIDDTGYNATGGQPTATTTWGGYVITAVNSNLRFYETVTPRAVHMRAQASGSIGRHEVSGSFLYQNGRAYDLQGGDPPPVLANTFDCVTDAVRVSDERMIEAIGTGLRVVDLDKQVDRDATTTFSAADTYQVAHPLAGVRITGLAAAGNVLIAAEVRSDGVWLEAFDIRKVRNRKVGATLAGTDRYGEFRVANFVTTTTLLVDVSLHHGRALVSLDDSGAISPGFYVVDIRPLLDDDSGTGLTATQVQGAVNVLHVRDAVGVGDYAYLGTLSGFVALDIHEAMDEDPLTTVPLTAARVTIPGAYDAVAAYGSYAYASPYGGGGIRSIDISQPTAPVTLSTLAYVPGAFSCQPTLDTVFRTLRSGISVHGSRGYATTGNGLIILDLE